MRDYDTLGSTTLSSLLVQEEAFRVFGEAFCYFGIKLFAF